MECNFCNHERLDGWYLSGGGFGCNNCITKCEQSLCENFAFQRRRGVSRCKQCWGKIIEEEEEFAKRSYEERLARWKEEKNSEYSRFFGAGPKPSMNESRKREYFCRDCKNLLNNRKCENTNSCNIGNPKLLTKKEQIQQSDELEIVDSDNFYFSQLVKSLDGYFEWPSTETNPSWFGSSILDANGWPVESPLKLLGYNVNQKENLSAGKRFTILAFSFKSTRLPWVKDQRYMLEWGCASSSARLKRIANHLAAMGRRMRNKHFTEALNRYDTDLAFLKENFYKPMFKFSWPSTEGFEE